MSYQKIAVLVLSLGAVWAKGTQSANELRSEAMHYRQLASHQLANATKLPMSPGSREHYLWLAANLETEAARLDGKPPHVAEASCCVNCCSRVQRSQPCAE